MRAALLLLSVLLAPTAAAEPVGVFAPTDEELRETTDPVYLGVVGTVSPDHDPHAVGRAVRDAVDAVDPEGQHVGRVVDDVQSVLPADLVGVVMEDVRRILETGHCGASPQFEGQTGVLVDPEKRHVYVFVGLDTVPENLSTSVSVLHRTLAVLSLHGGEGAGADGGACAPHLGTTGYVWDRLGRGG